MKLKVAASFVSVSSWSLRYYLYAGDRIMLNYIDSCAISLELHVVCL